MAQSVDVLVITVQAASTTGLTEGRFAAHGGQSVGAGGNALGIALMGARTGENAAVLVLGTAVAEAGAAISVGDAVRSDANGKAIPRPSTSTDPILGRALQAAAADGDKFELLLIPN